MSTKLDNAIAILAEKNQLIDALRSERNSAREALSETRSLLQREQIKAVALLALSQARGAMLRAAGSDRVDGPAIAGEARAIEALVKLGVPREALL